MFFDQQRVQYRSSFLILRKEIAKRLSGENCATEAEQVRVSALITVDGAWDGDFVEDG